MVTLSSLKTSQQHFVRCSALTSSRRRSSSRRRRSGTRIRQVRFQPVPQSIDISNTTIEDENVTCANQHPDDLIEDQDEDGVQLTDDEEDAQEPPKRCSPTGMQRQEMEQQVPKCKKQKQRRLTTKPLAKKLHHLSHLKFNKIKLKSLNNFAQQLQQTLTPSSGYAPARCDQQVKSSSKLFSSSSTTLGAKTKNNIGNSCADQVGACKLEGAEEDLDWGSDFDEQSSGELSLVLQNDSIRQSVDTNDDQHHSSNAYLLEIGKQSYDQRAIADVIQDQGICGQFKRLDVSQQLEEENLCYSSETNQEAKLSKGAQSEAESQSEGQNVNQHHKLMIELERRHCAQMVHEQQVANEDEQDQDGGFQVSEIAASDKEDHLNNGSANKDHDIGEEQDEDEAELRSLEARQGFKQIRDKLKVILDQRLASYERSAGSGATTQAPPEPPGNSGGATSDTCRPNKPADAITAIEGQMCTASQVASSIKLIPTTEECGHDRKTGEFDCQSHCSDASSSSSGLESNHSGSQDSGHSTQHSGFSCAGHHHHDHDQPPSIEVDQPSPVQSDRYEQEKPPQLEAASNVNELPVANLGPQSQVKPAGDQAKVGRENGARDQEEEVERRSRFLKNRLIINNKLESMFKSKQFDAPVERQSPNAAEEGKRWRARGEHLDEGPNQFRTLPRSLTSSSLVVPQTTARSQAEHLASSSGIALDPETRLRLLEQQRQMSLKLKQKPRRKSLKRLINDSRFQSVDSDETYRTDSGQNGSYWMAANGEPNERVPAGNELGPFVRTGSRRSKANNSITKQLSMICLRQASMPDPAAQVALAHNQSSAAMIGNQSQRPFSLMLGHTCEQPRAAQSLRQLVKDVIDDCERPGKLSTLTMSILNRSDSFSSDLAAGAADRQVTSPSMNDLQQQSRPPVGSSDSSCSANSSLSSLSAVAASESTPNRRQPQQQQRAQDEQPALHSETYSRLAPVPTTCGAVVTTYLGCTSSSSPNAAHNCSTYTNYSSYSFTATQTRANYTATGGGGGGGAFQVMDQSLSSMGSIDGLEYSRGCSELSVDVEHLAQTVNLHQMDEIELQQRQQQQQQSNWLAGGGHKSAASQSVGSYLKSWREFSRFKLAKVKLMK